MFIMSVLCFIFVKETYIPRLEELQARKLIKSYPNVEFISTMSKDGGMSLEKYLLRPYKLLFTHTMIWLSCYACLAFGIMYMGAACTPSIMAKLYNWDHAKAVSVNVAQFIGIFIASGLNFWMNQAYKRHIVLVKTKEALWWPELRFRTTIIGGFLIPLGFVLLYHGQIMHWTAIGVSLILIGSGFFLIFQATLKYVIDIHGHDSASAVSAITLLRSVAAGILPLLATFLLDTLGLEKFCIIMILHQFSPCRTTNYHVLLLAQNPSTK